MDTYSSSGRVWALRWRRREHVKIGTIRCREVLTEKEAYDKVLASILRMVWPPLPVPVWVCFCVPETGARNWSQFRDLPLELCLNGSSLGTCIWSQNRNQFWTTNPPLGSCLIRVLPHHQFSMVETTRTAIPS